MKIILSLFIISLVFKSAKCSLVEDLKQCYSCKNDCSSPTVQTCASGFSCFSKVAINGEGRSIHSKGCIETDSDVDLCNNTFEEILTCYTCDDDLCNKNNGAGRCYFCNGECSEPADEEYCVTTDFYGKLVKTACRSYENRTEDEVRVTKGCVSDDTDTRTSCEEANQNPGVNCTICETDICNSEEEEAEEYVEECYFCSMVCGTELKVQNCTEKYGKDVRTRCLTIDTLLDEEHNIQRECIVVTSTVQQNCDSFLQSGSKCTFCDTNLCNGNEDGFVDECYWCDGTCKYPMHTQWCEGALGPGVNSRCITVTRKKDGKTIETRKCVDLDATECETIKLEGGDANCTICDSHLCNDGSAADDGDDDDDDDDDDNDNNDGDNNSGLSGSQRIHSIFYILLLTCSLLLITNKI